MIFCVEDDANIRQLVVYTLESTGFQAKGFITYHLHKIFVFSQISVTFIMLWSHAFAVITKHIQWIGENFGELENKIFIVTAI